MTVDGPSEQRPRPGGCCDGGWQQVSDEYAHAMAKKDRKTAYDPVGNPTDRERFTAFRDAYTPCRVHNPVLHQRWAGGHLDAGHHCDECN